MAAGDKPMMAMRYMIRRAGAEELPGVVACLAAAFEPYRAVYTPDAFTDTVPDLNGMKARLETMTILYVPGPSGQVAGTIACAVLSPGEGHLRGLAVLPEFQGRGVADELLLSAEDELRNLGCSRVTLDTTAPLLRAMHFYAIYGYLRTGRVSDFYGMQLFEYEKHL
jgi:ribosomal protein S18 acetylase RimI-like enzyme